jgi:acyl carrier protein
LEEEYAAPTGEIESTIAGIWQQTLGLGRVGVHDNFFDLGGHSLHLISVHGKLKESLDRDIPMVDMFKYPTVSALAGYLAAGDGQDADAGAEPAEATERIEAGKSRLSRLAQRRKRRDG